eukprot:gene17978-biopygen18927
MSQSTSNGDCPPTLWGELPTSNWLHAAHGANEQFLLHVKTKYHEGGELILINPSGVHFVSSHPLILSVKTNYNCPKALLAGAIRAQKTSIPTPQNTYPGLLATQQRRAHRPIRTTTFLEGVR